MNEVYGILGAALIGASLGLLGSGGSILTIPVLVYVLAHEEKTAIVESLVIVGVIAGIGAVGQARRGLVSRAGVLWFGGSGVLGTALGAFLSSFVPGPVQLGLLAVVMLAAAWSMLRPAVVPLLGGSSGASSGQDNASEKQPSTPARQWTLALAGAGVGCVTGLLGVGGGFLIVPALTLLAAIPMRVAIGTSMAIIAINCVVGFAKHSIAGNPWFHAINWNTVATFTLVGVVGSFFGARLGASINQRKLRTAFGAVLVLIAGFVLVRELPRLREPQSAPANDPTTSSPATSNVGAPSPPASVSERASGS
ncbi:MAG: sulfite exporter TauE/SafE family protein [Planctomycetota bacterium]|nr:sulfite exporter TauE/SafE family protein [Planctomycetota bacterium]